MKRFRYILFVCFLQFPILQLSTPAANAQEQEGGIGIYDVYVNGLSRSTATINWRSNIPTLCHLAFGSSSILGDTIQVNAQPDSIFQVQLDSLQELTLYFYKILLQDSSGTLVPELVRQFRTPNTSLLYFNNMTDKAGTAGPTKRGDTGGHSVCFTDIDGDSLPDLYITMAFLEPRPDLFFHNSDGSLFFEEAAERGIADLDGGSHGAVFFDVDNDGDYDLYNGTTDSSAEDSGRNRLYLNDGSGHFTDVSDSVGLPDIHFETRAVTAMDYDRDGDLDLMSVTGYLGNEDPASDRNEFYHNNLMETGVLRFEPIDSSYFNIALAGQGLIDTDWDGDGDVDLIAANRTGNVHFFRNEKNSLVAVPLQSLGLSEADSARDGITTADIDNDGDLDLLLTGDNYGILYKRMLTGHYVLSQRFDGTDGYMGDFADLDNDTDLDLVFSGGTVVYLNDGNGVFHPGPEIPIDTIEDPRAVGFADIDLDGDVDFAYACKRSKNQLFRNKLNSGNWLKISLKSRYGQAGAKGAKVLLYSTGSGGKLIGHREVHSVSGYLGQNEPVLNFGLADNELVDILVVFPDGSVARRNAVKANSTIAINGPDADTAAPLVYNIRESEITQTSANLSFYTNEATFIKLNYGPKNSSLTLQMVTTSPSRLHSFALSNLAAGTEYAFQIEARDGSGNVATQSGAFSTIGPTPVFGLFEKAVTVPQSTESFYLAPPRIDIQFTGIDGEALNQQKMIAAFWDGDSTFRVRFVPEVSGTWQWLMLSEDASLNGQTGQFVCATKLPEGHSLHNGFVHVSEMNPYTFAYQDGTPYFLMGDTQWSFSTDALLDLDFKRYVDVRAGQGFNYIHGVAYQIFPQGNDKNAGGQAFINNDPDSLNPGFWQEFDKRIAYLNEKGIVAGFLVAWGGDGWQNFQTQEQAIRFAEYVVHRYAAYNVFWIVAGEFEEASVVGGYADIAHALASADPYAHPITTHTVHSSADSAEALPWQSFIYQQTTDPELITFDRVHEKPVVNSEFGYEGLQPADSLRMDAWQIVMRGGFPVYGNKATYHYSALMTEENLYSEGARYMQNLGEFFAKAAQENVNWWEISRFDSLEPDLFRAYISEEKSFYYSENKQGFAFEIPDTKQYWLYQFWFNTRTGEWIEIDTIAVDSTQFFVPPDSAYAAFFHLVNVADTAVSGDENLSLELRVSQNYPNPFNALTQWRIEIGLPGQLNIRIYDTRGRLVKSLYSGGVKAGAMKLVWDGMNKTGGQAANGVYILQVKFSSTSGTNKTLAKRLVYLK